MSNSELKSEKLPQRLCTEIQLFDLCDLDSCHQKNGRFCSDKNLIYRFEKIAEEEIRQPDLYNADETDDSELDDELEFGDDGDLEEFEDDYDIDREEE